MPQAFLTTGQHRLFIASLEIDDAIRHEPGLREGWSEQVSPCDAPKHPAACPRYDSRCKKRRGRAVNRAIAAARHLMQRAKRQSALREMPVDRLDAEGQHRAPSAGSALEAPDTLSKVFDTGTGDRRSHGLCNGLGG